MSNPSNGEVPRSTGEPAPVQGGGWTTEAMKPAPKTPKESSAVIEERRRQEQEKAASLSRQLNQIALPGTSNGSAPETSPPAVVATPTPPTERNGTSPVDAILPRFQRPRNTAPPTPDSSPPANEHVIAESSGDSRGEVDAILARFQNLGERPPIRDRAVDVSLLPAELIDSLLTIYERAESLNPGQEALQIRLRQEKESRAQSGQSQPGQTEPGTNRPAGDIIGAMPLGASEIAAIEADNAAIKARKDGEKVLKELRKTHKTTSTFAGLTAADQASYRAALRAAPKYAAMTDAQLDAFAMDYWNLKPGFLKPTVDADLASDRAKKTISERRTQAVGWDFPPLAIIQSFFRRRM